MTPATNLRLDVMATKKGSKSKITRPPRSAAKTSPVEQAQTMAELHRQLAESAKELQDCRRQLAEALEHQAATSEVLGIISRSPTDVQPVLDAIVESAARVCGIDDVVLRLVEGNTMVPRAHVGSIPIGRDNSIDEPHWRWMREHGTHHVPDVRAQNDFFRSFRGLSFRGVWCTYLGVPLRQQGEFIGALYARRTEVHPFTPTEIKLLETFADQAVIAIENARLFQELKESLEQQTATSEILGVIASSPTDIQPVLDAIARSTGRFVTQKTQSFDWSMGMCCDWRRIKDLFLFFGPSEIPINRGSVTGRAVLERQPIHVEDLLSVAATEFPEILQAGLGREGDRTQLAVPLVREGVAIGAILIRRKEVDPFTEKQIALVKPLPIRPSLPSRTCGCSKRFRSATPSCARRWSIRRRRPRCSASSAARPRTCSRCSTPSSRAPLGFVGLMMCCCDFARGMTMVARAHFGSIPVGRDEISIDEPQYRWMREHGTLHVPDVRAQNDFPTMGSAGIARTILGRSPSSAGGTHWNAERTSHRGAPLHPGADQAPRNLRRSSRHRHRERAAVPRAQGVVGAANGDE